LYIPAEDSNLLAETVKEYSGKKALEIGIGSGIVLVELQRNFELVVGTDLHLHSLRYARLYTRSRNILAMCCNMSAPIRSKFDLIVSNPPYLPDLSVKIQKDLTIDGGPTGIEWSINFLESSISKLEPTGKILLLLSSFSNIGKLDLFLQKWKFAKNKVNQKKLFYETIKVFEISRM
jgi:release factor glutamine methyltransferase